MAMKSLAVNYEETEIAKGPEQPYYPSIRLQDKQIPELDGKEIGAKVVITIEAEVTAIEQFKKGVTEYRLDLKKGEIKE